MDAKHVSPTRMEFARLKKKLVTAIHGHKLLKGKRNELICQFLDLMRRSEALREKVEAGIAAINRNFVLACSSMTDKTLNVALMAPKQEVCLETETKNVMSMEVPVFKYKTRTSDPNDIYSYGFIFTSSDLDDAVKSLANLLPDVLRLAECKKSCQLTTTEIEEIRHRVNTLGHVMIPDTQPNIRYITMKLDENERSSQTRLMKVRNMMPEEAHHCSEREVVPVADGMQQTSS